MAAPESFDAVIVGAGISGSLIAKQLGLKGKKVLVLEAGAENPPNIDAYLDRFYRSLFKVPEIPYTPDLFTPPANSFADLTDPGTVNAGRPTVLTLGAGNWQNPKQAYLIQKGPLAFASTYDRVGGGTTRHWLGTSLRFVPHDFTMKTTYDREIDWPFGYSTLEPWYGKAEWEIGVSADKADQDYLGIAFPPNYNYPMPGIPESMVDDAISSGVKGLQIDNIALTVSPTPQGRNSQPYQSRRVCAGNTNCIPICPIQAKYDASVTMNDALQTKNVQVRYRSVASNIVVGANGRIAQIDYITYKEDKGPRTGTGSVTAKVFIMAGHAIETPKLLLMSKNGGRTKDGVANSSKLVGKNLMDHPLYLAWALMPKGKSIFPYRGPLSTAGIESMRDGAFRKDRAAFRIEIGNEGWNFPIGDPYTTTVDFVSGSNVSRLNDGNQKLSGSQLVSTLNDLFTRQFRFGFLVEQTADEKNCVSLSNVTDHLGLPRPQINYNLSDYTVKGLLAAQQTASTIFKTMGAKEFTVPADADDPSAAPAPGQKNGRIKYFGSGHVVGTYCMGTDKHKSVVDANQRSWDHPNLFLTGSGVFPTVATANPTLTLAALSLMAADTILKTDLK
jgi:choline dehydrogenase-like flavoprotein